MVASTGVKDDVSRRVALVLAVVNIEPNGTDLDSAEKVDRQKMRLLTVGSKKRD